MNKIKLARLFAWAKERGYTGDENDAEAIRKHLLDAKLVVKGKDGKDIDLKTVEIAVETKASSVAVLEDDDTEDLDDGKGDEPDNSLKIKSAVETAMKGLGFDLSGGKRPGAVDTTERDTIKVKSVAQKMWETNNSQRGGKVFGNWDTACKWRDFLAMRFLSPHPDCAANPFMGPCAKRLVEAGIASKALLSTKAYGETVGGGGDALTTDIFYPELINNVLQYGVARRLARVVPMNSEKQTHPVGSGIHTNTFPEENSAATASTGRTYSNVQLVAKTCVGLAQVSKQLMQDSGIDMAQEVMVEFARAQAYTEDICMFSAAGEAAYGGHVGLVAQFAAIGAAADAGPNVSGAGTAAHAIGDISDLMSRLPQYARQGCVFTCSPMMSAHLFTRLAAAQGGVTWAETTQYGYVQKFMGIPIVENNIMPSTVDASGARADVYLGNFKMGCLFGDRMSMQFEFNDSVYFTSYGTAARLVTRFHLVNHLSGTTSTVAGPIVFLAQT